MSGKIVFYALSRKFLEAEAKIPATAQQVMYQTLALGHHIGVIDCLKVILECPLPGFERWLTHLPEGEARAKLAGILRFGEIMIDASHTQLLALALDRSRANFSIDETHWSERLMQALAAIEAEPAMYLMVKRHAY